MAAEFLRLAAALQLQHAPPAPVRFGQAQASDELTLDAYLLQIDDEAQRIDDWVTEQRVTPFSPLDETTADRWYAWLEAWHAWLAEALPRVAPGQTNPGRRSPGVWHRADLWHTELAAWWDELDQLGVRPPLPRPEPVPAIVGPPEGPAPSDTGPGAGVLLLGAGALLITARMRKETP